MNAIKKYIVIHLILTVGTVAWAQVNTMYFMDGIPGKTYLNPAKQPKCNFFIGPPVASNLQINIYNSAFSQSDLMFYGDGGDSVVTFLHPSTDINDFLDNFKKSNVISGETSFNIASFGFRINQMYFTLNVTPKMNLRYTYPGDLIDLLLTGNQDGQTFDFSAFGLNSKAYIEYGIGVSRKIMDNLSVGIRPKLYSGIFTTYSNLEDVSLYTSLEEWRVTTKGEINMAMPLVDFPVDNDGNLDLENDDFSNDLENKIEEGGFTKNALFDNKGLGVDLGVVYQPLQILELSASVVDLGYINWKRHTHNFILDGEYSITAFDVDDFDNDDTTSNFADDLIDSVKNSFSLEESSDGFITGMEPSIFIGGRYFVNETFDVGLLLRGKFYHNHFRKDMTISTNFRPSRAFNLSLSYSLLDGVYSNFGVGTSIRLGPFHFYLVTDDIFFKTNYLAFEEGGAAFPIFDKTKSINFRTGFNLQFGCNKKKKQMKDMPILYSDEAFIY